MYFVVVESGVCAELGNALESHIAQFVSLLNDAR